MPFTPQYPILPESQRRLWPELAPIKDLGFTLYGGTAIALRLGHRESVDFDFFSAAPLDKDTLRATLPALAREGAEIVQDEPNAFTVLVPPPAQDKGRTGANTGNNPATEPSDGQRVKLSFFGELDIGRVARPELTTDGVLLVASLRDLMATKLKVIFDRIELKDYLDIHEMLAQGASLNQGLSDANSLWPVFTREWAGDCLGALTYFEARELKDLSVGHQDALLEKAAETADELLKEFYAPSRRLSDDLGLSPREWSVELSALATMQPRHEPRDDSAPDRPRGGRER